MLSVEFDDDAVLLLVTTEMASETKVTNMKISSDYKLVSNSLTDLPAPLNISLW